MVSIRRYFEIKKVLLILRYIFGEVAYDEFSYDYGHSIAPLRLQVLKNKTGYLRFGMTSP